MLTLRLPSQDRRALVRSFCAVLSGTAAVPWLALGWWYQAPLLAYAGLAAGAVTASILLGEDRAWRAYRAWNPRVVRPFTAAAARVVTAVCYLVVIAAAGRRGTRLPLGLGGPTAWVTRAASETESDDARGVHRAGGHAAGWAAAYGRWAWQTGNLWSVALLPFLALLRLFPPEKESAGPENIYTLF